MGRPARGPALVVVPTYNERDSIEIVVERALDEGSGVLDVLVVDDSSPDGTGEVIRALAATRRVHLLQRARKLGLGTAYVEGFRWALERGYEAVVEMDGDLSHDPSDVTRLLAALEDADLVIGSRYVPGGRIPSWGLWRRALSRGGNAYARRLLGFRVTDSTSGLRAYRADALHDVDLAKVSSEGYAFQIEMTRRVHRAGGRILEIPITFSERSGDRSKLTRAVVLEALVKVTLWGAGDLARRGRRRVAERLRLASPPAPDDRP